MPGAPRANVQAPAAIQPIHSLLASASLIGRPGERWQSGISYQPEACGEGGVSALCEIGERSFAAGPDVVQWDPILVWAADVCTTLDSGRDREARARRNLQRILSREIAQELWSGAIARANSYPNMYLAHANSDVLTAGATGVVDALACLEQALGECAGGTRGMIHASRQVITHWQANSLLHRDGNRLLTALDTIVVADGGYNGDAPNPIPDAAPIAAADGSIWAYATDMVEIRLDAVEILTAQAAQRVDRSLNTDVVVAQQLALASWNRCCHFAVEIDLNLCDVGGPGS